MRRLGLRQIRGRAATRDLGKARALNDRSWIVAAPQRESGETVTREPNPHRDATHARVDLARGRGALRFVAFAAVAALLAVLALSLAAPGYTAEAPPHLTRPGRVEGIRATRAATVFPTVVPSDSNLEQLTELSESEQGPWKVLSITKTADEQTQLTHLKPETVYYVRFLARSPVGEASEIVHFTTTASTSPELAGLAIPEFPGTIGEGKDLGTGFAGFEAQIQTNGAETAYAFEFASSAGGPWAPFTTGGSGHVSVAEDAAAVKATVSGLSPETEYFARVSATNSNGSVISKPQAFKTLSTRPSAHLQVTPNGVAATFARIDTSFSTRSFESHWQLEYATEPQGPWITTGAAGGTVTAEAADTELSTFRMGAITGLTPGTLYYVRVVVDNGHGEAASDATSFRTAGPPTVAIYETHSVDGEDLRALGGLDTDVAPVGEVQLVTEGGGASAGSFTLSFEGETTAPIPFGAAPGVVSGALEHLGRIGDGNVVAQSPTGLGGFPYTIIFIHGDAGIDEPQLTANSSELAPSGEVTVTTLQNGFEFPGHYHFEYVSQTQFEASGFAQASVTPEAAAPTGSSEEGPLGLPTTQVGADLPSLQPGGTYRYRLVASNGTPGDPVVRSTDATLTVPSGAAASGGGCPNEAMRSGPSALLPDCRAFEQLTPTEKKGAQDIYGYTGVETGPTVVAETGERLMLHAVGVAWGDNPDPHQANYVFARTAEGWEMTSTRSSSDEPSSDFYEPLVNDADLTSLGVEVGWTTGASSSPTLAFEVGPPGGPYANAATIPASKVRPEAGWAAESADGSTLVLQTEDRTLAGASTGTLEGDDLYEYSNGRLRQVNVTSAGGKIGTCGASLPSTLSQNDKPIAPMSTDGHRILFYENCTHDLYMREDGERTTSIGGYELIALDADAETLLLQRKNGETYELLRYDTNTHSFVHLLTSETKIGGGQLAFADDFATIYLMSPERFSTEAPATIARGEEYVYRYRPGEGAPEFLFQLAPRGGASTFLATTSDGRYLYFEAENVPGVPGLHPGEALRREELYRYDSRERLLSCVACASPLKPNGGPFSRGTQASDDGQYVFFDTYARLVPEDSDGEVPSREKTKLSDGEYETAEDESQYYSVSSDVYEWRASGTTGCTKLDGCISLITTGKGGLQNALIPRGGLIVPSGRDVFFATHEALVTQDKDTAGDIYDARIDGGFAPSPTSPIECSGDACSTPFAPPAPVTPASETFSGPGNPLVSPLTHPAVKTSSKKKKTKEKKKRGKHKHKGTAADDGGHHATAPSRHANGRTK